MRFIGMADIAIAYLDTLAKEDTQAPYALRTRAASALRARRLRETMSADISTAGGLNCFMRTLAVVAPRYYAGRRLGLPKEVQNARHRRVHL